MILVIKKIDYQLAYRWVIYRCKSARRGSDWAWGRSHRSWGWPIGARHRPRLWAIKVLGAEATKYKNETQLGLECFGLGKSHFFLIPYKNGHMLVTQNTSYPILLFFTYLVALKSIITVQIPNHSFLFIWRLTPNLIRNINFHLILRSYHLMSQVKPLIHTEVFLGLEYWFYNALMF